MSTANYSINHNSVASGAAADGSVGMAVLKTDEGYIVASLANRTSEGRGVDGIALDDFEAGKAFRVAHDSLVDAAHSGLPDGAKDDFVVVEDDGTLSRTASPGGSAVVIGQCPGTNGDFHLSLGSTPGGGGGSSEGSAGAVNVSDGSGGWDEATNVKAGASYVSVGASPATTGNWRMTATGTVHARDAGGTKDLGVYSVGGVAGSEYISIGIDENDDPTTAYNTIYLTTKDRIAFDISQGGGTGYAVMAANSGDPILHLEGGMDLAISTSLASPAASIGAVRLSQDGSIWIRNEANTDDLRVFVKSNLNVLTYGSGASDTWVDSGTGGSFLALADTHRILSGSGGTEFARFSSSGFQLNNGPSILTGTGVPASSPANGSLFLRTDGTSTTALYSRQGGAWAVVGGSATSFADNVFEVTDNGDATKKLAFECSGITTATTRTLTVPNASGTLPLLSLAQTWSALQSFDSSIAIGGGTPATTGLIRTPYNGGSAQNIIVTKDGAAADKTLLSISGNAVSLVSPAGGTVSLDGSANVNLITTAASVYLYASTNHNFYNYTKGGMTLQMTSTAAQLAVPLGGNSGESISFRWQEAAITQSSTADTTLTAAQYMCPVLNITGTPGGAFNVIAPNTAKSFFIVINNTASACTIKKSGGTGVTIAAGKSAQVYHSGSDYVRITADA